jgi:hypothetical protein
MCGKNVDRGRIGNGSIVAGLKMLREFIGQYLSSTFAESTRFCPYHSRSSSHADKQCEVEDELICSWCSRKGSEQPGNSMLRLGSFVQ